MLFVLDTGQFKHAVGHLMALTLTQLHWF